MITFTIKAQPKTKKNSQQIAYKWHGKKKIPFIIPSKAFLQYKKDCGWLIGSMVKNMGLDGLLNIKCTYYMKTKGKVDLTNLLSATMDILVDYNVIKDDHCKIAYSNDGSRVRYDKDNPRTEIEITLLDDPAIRIRYNNKIIERLNDMNEKLFISRENML